MAATGNRYDIHELAGAFGDLGTLIPFVAAYVSVVKMNPSGILVAVGSTLMVVGSIYRTPFPMEPMKAIGAAAITQLGSIAVFSASSVMGTGVVTGLLWAAARRHGSRPAVGVRCRTPRWWAWSWGLASASCFMLQGIRRMADRLWIGGALALGSGRPGCPGWMRPPLGPRGPRSDGWWQWLPWVPLAQAATRERQVATRASAASRISSSVVGSPMLRRTAPSARFCGMPMAPSTPLTASSAS